MSKSIQSFISCNKLSELLLWFYFCCTCTFMKFIYLCMCVYDGTEEKGPIMLKIEN